jgi:superfamily II DNA or RNA helicase
MISQQAITEFLTRPLANFDWIKKSTEKELRGALYQYANTDGWWNHQRACFMLLKTLKRFMLFVDMGGGKTRIILYLIRFLKRINRKTQAIVFVPYITSVDTWIEETKLATPELVCFPLTGSTDYNRLSLEERSADLFVIAYPSAVAMMAKKIATPGKAKGKWDVDPAEIRQTFARFNIMVLDEVHRTKKASTLTFRLCRAISAQAEYVTGLTGTPFGRDLQDLWPQFYLIDWGKTLGKNISFYRSVFFNQSINYWGGYEYKFKAPMMESLKRIIKNRSIRYSIDDLYDMPPKLYVKKLLHPHDAIQSYLTKGLEAMRQLAANKAAYRELESEYMKLRQLASGFLTLHGEDNDKVHVAFDVNPKLDVLQELIEDMPNDCKMVVFHHFVFTNELISNRLKQMKVKHAKVYGKTKDPLTEIRRFRDDDKCAVLVINSRSGSSALNLQHANYICFFEQPDSPIDRQQAERRCWRPGQDKRVEIYDLLMKGTVDWPMYSANKAGENLLKNLLDGKIQL